MLFRYANLSVVQVVGLGEKVRLFRQSKMLCCIGQNCIIVSMSHAEPQGCE